MKNSFIPVSTIRCYAEAVIAQYEQKIGPIKFPLDVADMFDRLFDLQTVFDDTGKLDDAFGPGVIGCLFPPGQRSPWGRDKLIVVNATAPYKGYSSSHTIAHEGGGHFILHFLQGVAPRAESRPVFCRDVGKATARKDPLEWQADRFAGELVMPAEKVRWLLDGKKSGELINLDLYGKNFQEYFDTSRAQMEKRLVDLGYLLMQPKYQWANYLKGKSA
jgi:hypothetical protein